MKQLQKIVFRFFFVFVLLFILTVPFPFHILPWPGNYTGPWFTPLLDWTGRHVFGISKPFTAALLSDSTGMYIHVFLLALLALLSTAAWSFVEKKEKNYERLQYWFHTVLSYYLSLQLFKYGFSKLFKHQFYQPEPNTLFTPLGKLSHDILYWSTMGSSYSYSVFTGLIELLPAVLLLFRRTRRLGALLAVAVLFHVVMINFGFDISVKVFSGFLLMVALLLAMPALKKLTRLFLANKLTDDTQWLPSIRNKKQAMLYAALKAAVISLLLFETLLPYFQTGNFNDDKAVRIPFHGAYEVETFVAGNDTLEPLLTDQLRFRRFFIHREGYFIVQQMNDDFYDYKMSMSPVADQITLTGHKGETAIFELIPVNDSLLYLDGKMFFGPVKIRAKKMATEKLPLLQPGFHWTIDDY